MSAFREAARTSEELKHLGVNNQHLVVNGVFAADSSDDPIAAAMQLRGDEAIAAIPETLQALDRTTDPISSRGLMGVDTLRQVGQSVDTPIHDVDEPELIGSYPEGLGSLIDELAAPGHGVIMTMGKGGVGKTTVAAAVGRCPRGTAKFSDCSARRCTYFNECRPNMLPSVSMAKAMKPCSSIENFGF